MYTKGNIYVSEGSLEAREFTKGRQWINNGVSYRRICAHPKLLVEGQSDANSRRLRGRNPPRHGPKGLANFSPALVLCSELAVPVGRSGWPIHLASRSGCLGTKQGDRASRLRHVVCFWLCWLANDTIFACQKCVSKRRRHLTWTRLVLCLLLCQIAFVLY